MKKKILSILIIVLVVVGILFIANKSNAQTMGSWADYSYDTVIGYDPASLIADSWTYDGDDIRFNRRNYLCLEKYVVTGTVNFYVAAVIDINTDGNDPNSYTYTYKTSSGSATGSGSDSRMAKLAYIAQYAEANKISRSYDTSQAFSYVWDCEGASGLIPDMPEARDYASNSVYEEANNYATNGADGEGKTYSARILVFKGGAMQNTALLYGKEATLQQKVEITKYIKNIEPDNYVGIVGDARAAHKADDDWKKSNKPKVEKDAIVTYEITIENVGSVPVEGTFTDTYDSELEFKSAKSGGNDVNMNGENISLQNKNDKVTIIVKLKASDLEANTTYKNTAKFQYKDSDKTIESSDYFVALTEDIKINKYITSVDGTSYSRSGMTEDAKVNSPVSVGDNTTSHTINYSIVITNSGSETVTGTFTDTHDSELSGDVSTYPSGSSVTISGGSSVTISYQLTVAMNVTAGIYENMGIFSWNSDVYGELEISSSDWITIEGNVDPPEADIKKYITEVNGTPVTDRAGLGITTKDGKPVEVEKGDVVTYRIEVTNKIWYQNRSAVNRCNDNGTDSEGRCASHYDNHQLDWLTCKDTFDSGLAYESHSGATLVDEDGNPVSNPTGNQIYFKWTDVDYEETVTVDLKLTVTSSNMKKMNLQNKVDDIKYQFSWYQCTINHAYYYCGGLFCSGHHDRPNCSFGHNYTIVNEDYPKTIDGAYYSGKIAGEDYDYVRLLDPVVSGVVWLENTKDGYKRDGESIANMKREEHKNVNVELWREDGTTSTKIASQIVNTSTGEFSFGRVKKGPNDTPAIVPDYNIPEGLEFKYTSDDLYHYYIIYDYDGERYEATTNLDKTNLDTGNHYTMKTDFDKDSNAAEIDREAFNNSLETISNDKAYAGTTSSATSKDLDYYEEGNSLQKSILKWDGDLGTTTTANVTMKAKSFTFYFTGGVDGDDTNYLRYINLGLVERESPDLSLTKDVISAEVTVNNHITTYNYNSLGTDPYVLDSNNVLAEPYLLSIYREDYEYRTSKYDSTIQDILNENNSYKDFGRDNDLHIILTYKITVTNNSPSATAVIRELIDYSSNELELLDTTVTIDGNALTASTSSSFSNPSNSSGTNFNQHFFTGNGLTGKSLAAGESLEVYARYRVLKDSDGYIFTDNATDVTDDGKANIAEIGAYSLYNGTTPAGLVDKNSNPGNIEFEGGKPKQDKFEDDTCETGVLVVLKDTPPPPPPPPGPDPETEKYYYRNISGIVFEEIDKSVTSTSDGQLVGDGIKNGNDIPAANVIVKLYEVVQKKDSSGNVIEEYYVDTGAWYRTGSDGRYYFGDKTEKFESNKPKNDESNLESKDDCYRIHSGLYTVRFIYGDEYDKLITTDGNTIKYSGQDYQSVKYTDVGDSSNEAEIVKSTAFSEKSGNTTAFSEGNPTLGSTIYSVAKDNEVRRLEVNQYSTTTTYPMDTILKANQGSNEAKLLAEHTSMFADTKTFDLDIEYYDNYTSKTEYTMDGKVKTIESFYYSVRDVNFGITQRPITKLQLMNDITEVRAITSDGNTLVDILFDVTYTKEPNGSIKHETSLRADSIGVENVQVLDRKGDNQGFRYVNVDSDLLQGMTITIKFRNAVANISEVDHLAKWLEDKIESKSLVELDVKNYNRPVDETRIGYNSNDSKITDYIDGQEREYNYINSYLYELLYDGDSSKGISPLRNTTTGIHVYDGTEGVGSESVKKVYTYTNIKNKSHNDYSTGYYLGNIYYNNVSSGNEAKVKTKVDQYIDYVDNDLIFKPEENINANGQITYLTYTTEEIAKKGLLKDITPSVHSISDGKKDYYNKDVPNTNNNLAFNIEDGFVNADFYRFLEPITANSGDQIAKEKLYNIDLQASRILTSELDLEGVEVDNIAEIIKTTNTAGRKVYVKASEGNTGYLGNTTKDPIESINKPGSSTTIVDIAKLELDTDFTEYVTFSPPTGLVGQDATIKTIAEKTGDVLLILIPVVIIIVGMSYVTVQVVKRKKFYK